MRTTPNLGLTVWDSNNDGFSSSQLAANWDAIDADYTRTRPANKVQTVATLASVPSPAEGTLAYLTAADSGFAAGTLMRYTAATWKPVPGVELFTAVPTSGNFAGRIVLLSAAASGFSQWSLIRYDGSAWALLNHTYTLSATIPGSPSAGDLVMLTAAVSGFNAYDLIRYNGTSWSKVGPQAIPPATELLTYSIASDLTTTNTVSPGDTINTFTSTAFENVKYYFEVSIPWASHTITQGGARILLRESTTTIASLDIPTPNTANAPVNFHGKVSFIPTAANHTYALTLMTLVAGTFEIFGLTHGPATIRVVKA